MAANPATFHPVMAAHRVALISDVHGNELALRRVLEEIQRAGVDQIACLGDVASLGPRPRAVLELVRQECDVFILGNHDEYLLDSRHVHRHVSSPLVLGAIEQCRDELSAAEVDFIRCFERKVEIPLTTSSNLLLFHGSPDSNDCDLLSETPETELSNLLGGHAATMMAGGHTHIQMLRQHRGRLLINPGSVGLPFERFVAGSAPTLMPHAEYAIVEARNDDVGVSFRRVELDPAALADAARRWHGPLSAYLVEQYEAPT